MPQVERAYSLLTLKAATEADGKRTFTGTATTPSTDRMGDVVESEGAEFDLPIPLLWQHDSRQPIGWVTAAEVSSTGITVTCEMATVEDPGTLKDRLDEAWQSIKAKLVRGLSIGFSAIETARIEGTWGLRYLKWSWLELSAVTIPANADASIASVKSIDRKLLAASGHVQVQRAVPTVPSKSPVAGSTVVKTSTESRKGTQTMNIAERIANLQATRTAKAARMAEIMEKSANAGETTDAQDGEEFDTLSDEIAAVDKELSRLAVMQKANVSMAVPAAGGSAAGAAASRQAPANVERHALPASVKTVEKLDKGIEFARFVQCLGKAQGNLVVASALAQKHFPQNERLATVLKAAVDAGTTTDPTWAQPLVAYNDFAGDFIDYLRPRTILGQFGQGNIPGLRRIPFNVHIKGRTSGGTAGWVGEGKPKPVTRFDFNDVYLGFSKLAAITVMTDEMLKFGVQGTETMVRDALAEAVIERMDIDFIDPGKSAVNGVSPASITNGVTPIASTGSDEDSIRADIAQLWATADGINLPAGSAVYITNSAVARRLSMIRNPLGQPAFPGVTMTGGTLDGVPLLVSNYVAGGSGGGLFILAFASEIYLADDGQVMVDASREASIQMADNPTVASDPATPATMVSMFQTNSVALRAERYVNWQKRRPQAVAYLNDVQWGA